MNFKQLFTEDRAVSPVIGVILMVAITVILAAVIGTFVLGLGDQVSESAPQAQFTFGYTEDAAQVTAAGGIEDRITIVHDGGDSIQSDEVSVVVEGATAWTGSAAGTGFDTSAGTNDWTSEISAGSTIQIYENDEATTDSIQSGYSVRVIWSSSNSDKTATIGQSEVGF